MRTISVYLLANKRNTVLYIGVTSDLIKRIWQHKEKLVEGFTKKYNADKLVYYEVFDNIQEAIKREKYLKGKKRQYKISLIRKKNPKMKDLYPDLL
ncbi:MAG: endo/excinuclease amino terminal domain protein [Microgenomates bacterium 39_7]|nr:MAG: endo/excinuclease amino terminal domain protein [Microgenomates bacterium 39_7]